MINEFTKAWETNEDELKNKIKETEINHYRDLLELVIEEVINPEMDGYKQLDVDNITEINDGDYQGTQIYLIPLNTYQPYISDYIVTHNFYGSCAGCDALLDALGWSDDDKDIDSLMKLSLHLLQRMKWLEGDNK